MASPPKIYLVSSGYGSFVTFKTLEDAKGYVMGPESPDNCLIVEISNCWEMKEGMIFEEFKFPGF